MLVSSMTEKRRHFCGAALENKVFVFGGCSVSKVEKSAEMYDIGEDQWQNIPDLQVPRFCAKAAVVQGQIYVIGGNKPSSSAPQDHKRVIECYDPSTGQWPEKGSFLTCVELSGNFACCSVMIPKSLLELLPEL